MPARRTRKTRRTTRGGNTATTPTTAWPSWMTSAAQDMPSSPPVLTSSRGLPRAEAGIVRRLDFEDEDVSRPGCKKIHDQATCVSSSSATAADRAACLQVGEGQVQSLNDCGPTRVGGRRRKSRKLRKSRKSRKIR